MTLALHSVPPFAPTQLIDSIGRHHALRAGQDVHVLVDLDALSHVGPEDHERCADGDLVAGLTQLVEVAAALGRVRFRAWCSSRTAFVHWQALTLLPNNSWQIGRGLDGADELLIQEIDHLVARSTTGLILLFGGDHAYAEPTARAIASGVPVWVVARGGSLSSRLRDAATGSRVLVA